MCTTPQVRESMKREIRVKVAMTSIYARFLTHHPRNATLTLSSDLTRPYLPDTSMSNRARHDNRQGPHRS